MVTGPLACPLLPNAVGFKTTFTMPNCLCAFLEPHHFSLAAPPNIYNWLNKKYSPLKIVFSWLAYYIRKITRMHQRASKALGLPPSKKFPRPTGQDPLWAPHIFICHTSFQNCPTPLIMIWVHYYMC